MSEKPEKISLAILAYEGMTMLDAVGPNEVFANSPYFDVQWISSSQQNLRNDHKNFTLDGLAHYSTLIACDILLIPGGPGDASQMQDNDLLTWIKKIDEQTLLTTSVCTGSLILAKAGVLDGHKACTHWGCLAELEALGAKPVRKRFVQSGKYCTASGVSAGIDMALYLVEKLVSKKHARDIRFGIEYFPNKINLLSSYTLPKFLLNKLTKRFHQFYKSARESVS